MHRVSINEQELFFLELFRIALSAETLEDRLTAIRSVKHEVIAARLKSLSEGRSSGWQEDPANRELVEWVAKTAGEREDGIYEFSRVSRRYEDRTERRLNVAEHVGKMIGLSIEDGKFEGVQTDSGILYQLTEVSKEHNIRGAKDKDTVRKSWGCYRGVVHLGMAMDFCEDLSASPAEVLLMAEHFRRRLSQMCPKGTSTPYVSPEEQISFVYESSIYGPRFQNRGLPFYVSG
ncbi:hypothetical protein [Thalassovita sp.]|uniref:hypothetical protein n=1 Tax=Thalassovita sp. TaxID=1979401 RepID=UPI002B27C1C8|nr:hypothetical protein [Thalassovita sp.]